MKSNVTVRRLLASELGWANERYADVKFVASTSDDMAVVALVDGVKVGLGRMVPLGGSAYELGGIYVMPQSRGANVARAIVSHLVLHLFPPSQEWVVFCLPFENLAGFYGGFGFTPVPPDALLPPAIQAKVSWCKATYPTPVALLWRSSGAQVAGRGLHPVN